jgi:MFS family permease
MGGISASFFTVAFIYFLNLLFIKRVLGLADRLTRSNSSIIVDKPKRVPIIELFKYKQFTFAMITYTNMLIVLMFV